MALTFPTSAAKSEFIKRGAGDFYIGDFVSAGADAVTLRHLGPTQGGFSIDPKRTFHEVECDQFIGPVAAFPIKEEFTAKITVLDLTLANLAKALQLSPSRLTGGDRTDNSGTLLMGEETGILYHQFVWRDTPAPQSTATTSVIQLFKCVVIGVSEIKFEKAKESALQLTIRALTDPSISTAGKVGKWFEA